MGDKACAARGVTNSYAYQKFHTHFPSLTLPLEGAERRRGLLDRPVLVGKADDEVAKEAVGDETEHTQADNPNEDFVGGHPQARVEDEVAEASISSDHLSRDHGGERVPHRQVHARQDKWQGRW